MFYQSPTQSCRSLLYGEGNERQLCVGDLMFTEDEDRQFSPIIIHLTA